MTRYNESGASHDLKLERRETRTPETIGSKDGAASYLVDNATDAEWQAICKMLQEYSKGQRDIAKIENYGIEHIYYTHYKRCIEQAFRPEIRTYVLNILRARRMKIFPPTQIPRKNRS